MNDNDIDQKNIDDDNHQCRYKMDLDEILFLNEIEMLDNDEFHQFSD